MTLTWQAKKNIDFMGAAFLAAIAGYFAYSRKRRDTQIVVIVVAIALVLGYILISQLTKQFYLKGPHQVPTGSNCNDFDPRPITDAIREDIECNFCFRSIEAYDNLLALTDCEFTKCHNYWNQNYYSSDSLTMLQAMQNEDGSTLSPGTFTHQKEQIEARYRKLQLI